MTLTAEELLAGSEVHHRVTVPAALLHARDGETVGGDNPTVVLRPLAVRDLQLIVRGARDDDLLTSALMVQRALVEPELTQAQVAALPAGLLHYLANEVNRVSGIGLTAETVERMVQAPLARACFILANEFGWTPQQVSEMTLGQILLYLQMTGDSAADRGVP